MPFQVKAPAGEKYFLEKTDALYGVEGDPTFVVIREATHAEDRQRSALFSEITRVMDPAGKFPSQIRIQQSLNSDELKETDIYLTLADTNITDDDGVSPLFRFKQVGSIRKVDMSEKEFRAALAKLPGRIVDEIHEKVALKNPDWFGPAGEDL